MKKTNYFRNNIVWFIVATTLIIFLFPREETFRYAFVEGKPWQYGLLTAPFDFPVHKSPEQLKAEQDSVLQQFIPYFQHKSDTYLRQQTLFNNTCTHHPPEHWNTIHKTYVDDKLKEIYTRGIISNTDHQFLKDNRYNAIKVLEGKKTTLRATDNIFTIRTAYTYLLNNRPENIHLHLLQAINLNDYLHENLTYDENLSEKVKQEDLQRTTTPSGMIQAGEKIVDQGEIITHQTNNILQSLKQIKEEETGGTQHQIGLLAGIILLTGGLLAVLFFYLAYFRRKIYANLKDVIFLLTMTTLFIILTEIATTTGWYNIYIIPYAIIPIVVRTFFESRTAQTTHLITTLVCALMVPHPLEFILIQILACTVALYVLKDLTKRSEFIRCAISILATYILTYIGIHLFQAGEWAKINWNTLIYFGINFLFVMFTYAFIYIIERIFGYISNVTLVELSDINLPALTQLSEKAPGTFQHSLQVSMLGTAAAAKIGANPQLVRTGALYHDIGKMKNPAWFTENETPGANPHATLSPEQSARIITHHVPDGVKLAHKFGIPEAIIKFILTHHGAGKAKYFYQTYRNQHPNDPIPEAAFTYSGFNPNTKETAILMMADAVEAASHSLPDYREATIHQLVNRIIDGQINDGLLNDAPLTFQNITTVKNVFVDKLLSVYHSRIAYPEPKDTDTQ
jgi:putative nucleotidyltransferase with HDIG domain